MTRGSAIGSGSTVYVSYVAAHATWKYAHDPLTGMPTSEQQPGHYATVLTYTDNSDLGGHVADVATVTNPRGTATGGSSVDFMTTFTYSGTAPYTLTSVASPINAGSGGSGDLSTTSMTYNSYGETTSVTDGDGNVTKYEYASSSDTGQATKVHVPYNGTDPNLVQTQYTYDADGNATRIDTRTDLDSLHFVEFTYDDFGDTTVTTTPWDGTRRRADIATYDLNGNQTQDKSSIGYTPGTTTPTSPDSATPGVTTTTTFDADDRSTNQTLPDNNNSSRSTSTVYDAAGRATSSTTAAGYQTTYAWDAGGRQVEQMDPQGNANCTYYDSYDEVVASTLPKALSVQGAHCPSTQPTSFTETTSYDAAGYPTSDTGITGSSTSTSYDQDGNVSSTTDEMGKTTNYTPDAAGNAYTETDPTIPVCADASNNPIQPTPTALCPNQANMATSATARPARRSRPRSGRCGWTCRGTATASSSPGRCPSTPGGSTGSRGW
jgi:YD repeat-containing protein